MKGVATQATGMAKEVVIIEIRLNQYLFEIHLKNDQQASESFVLAGFLFRTRRNGFHEEISSLPPTRRQY